MSAILNIDAIYFNKLKKHKQQENLSKCKIGRSLINTSALTQNTQTSTLIIQQQLSCTCQHMTCQLKTRYINEVNIGSIFCNVCARYIILRILYCKLLLLCTHLIKNKSYPRMGWGPSIHWRLVRCINSSILQSIMSKVSSTKNLG